MPNTVLGKVSCVPRGDYSASATYTVLDIAGYQGGSYMALKTVTGVTPSNDGINWMQLSGPGLPGETGPQGEPGAAAGFGSATAMIDDTTGTPDVSVELSGPDTAKVFAFSFSGLKGETGAKGDTGDKGDTGATGPQGVSITDAEINESGRLIITLSAGEPIDAGNAVGPTGAKGDTGATGPEGASVSRIERTSGTGAPGTTDTYTVYLTDGSTGGTFNVYNGANGTGSGDFMADGSVPMTGALQMGGNRITNVGAPTADTDAVRQTDLKAVSDEVDKILDGTTPVAIPAATTAKIGGVIVGDGLSVETNGTISADSQLPTGGTTGQLLTKTASGTEWADAPSGLPDGATEGQMLYQGADGAEWGDKPVMVVHFSRTPDGPSYAVDKTFAEVLDAYNKGYSIYAIEDDNFAYTLSYIETNEIAFSSVYRKKILLLLDNNLGLLDLWSLYAEDVIFESTVLSSDNVHDAIEEVQGNIDAAKPVLRTATLTTSGWSSNSQTVTVNGVVANSSAQLIYVSPANKDSATAWGGAGVFCSAQGANSLTFVCDSVPSANISVNISIQEAQT